MLQDIGHESMLGIADVMVVGLNDALIQALRQAIVVGPGLAGVRSTNSYQWRLVGCWPVAESPLVHAV